MSAWTDHVARWKDCTACPLAGQRDRIVLARGQVPCDVVFVGEAPGASEDAIGLPFVGPAGHLLDQIIERALGLVALCSTCGAIRYKDADDWTCRNGHTRAGGHGGRDIDYALTNLVCCFPRDAKAEGTNEPSHREIGACRPRLTEFLTLCRPRLVVAVGALAAGYVPRHTEMTPMPELAAFTCTDIVHPAAILRMPLAQKRMAAQRAIVVIRNAINRVFSHPGVPADARIPQADPGPDFTADGYEIPF